MRSSHCSSQVKIASSCILALRVVHIRVVVVGLCWGVKCKLTTIGHSISVWVCNGDYSLPGRLGRALAAITNLLKPPLVVGRRHQSCSVWSEPWHGFLVAAENASQFSEMCFSGAAVLIVIFCVFSSSLFDDFPWETRINYLLLSLSLSSL